ncbi:MAG: AAA family ATPase, partial [Myxococcota bacterium]
MRRGEHIFCITGVPSGAGLARGLPTPAELLEVLVLSRAATRIIVELYEAGHLHLALSPWALWLDNDGELTIDGLMPPTLLPALRPSWRRAWLSCAAPEIASFLIDRDPAPLDVRCDLYALGACAYRALTGINPFGGRTISDLIRERWLTPAPDVRRWRPDVPAPVAEMVARLMSPLPEERYQTPRGLLDDLESMIEHYAKRGRIDPFARGLGRNDRPRALVFPQGRLGREAEAARLTQLITSVGVSGVIVCGPAGVGKTHLVDLGLQAFRAGGGSLLRLHCDRVTDRGVGEALLKAYEAHPGDAGTSPVVQMALVERHRTLAAQGPVLLWIDGLDRLAESQYPTLRTLLSSFAGEPLKVVVTTRSTTFGLARELTGDEGEVIRLGGWTRDTVHQLLRMMMVHTNPRFEPLAELVHEKTQGNPLAVRLFIRRRLADGGFGCDPSGVWTWDLKRLQRLPSIVLAASTARELVRQLPPSVQVVLEAAAALGTRFRSHELGAALER